MTIPPDSTGPDSAGPAASDRAFLDLLIEQARAVDGQPPFSDASLIELKLGQRRLLSVEHSAAAILSAGEAEFAVLPDARGRGIGTKMLETILTESEPGLLIWAHGDHPAARALAARHGLTPVRRLLQLRMPVPTPAGDATSETAAFRPGRDDAAWLRVNARAFASHPEQGAVTQHDLDEMMQEPWFNPDDFLLIHGAVKNGDGDNIEIAAFCWLKVDDGVGEFYVVGVDPDRQGEGLGRALMTAGFNRLADRGIRTAALYVEADNIAAVNLYRSLGFTEHSVDLQYAAR